MRSFIAKQFIFFVFSVFCGLDCGKTVNVIDMFVVDSVAYSLCGRYTLQVLCTNDDDVRTDAHVKNRHRPASMKCTIPQWLR